MWLLRLGLVVFIGETRQRCWLMACSLRVVEWCGYWLQYTTFASSVAHTIVSCWRSFLRYRMTLQPGQSRRQLHARSKTLPTAPACRQLVAVLLLVLRCTPSTC